MHFWKDGSWSGVCGYKPIVGPDEPETPSTAQELRPTGSPFGAIDASRTPTRRRTGGGGVAGSQAGAQWPGPERVPRDLALRGVPTPLHRTQDSSLTSQILSPLKFPLFLFFCLFLCFPGPSSPCALSAEVRSAAPILSLVSPCLPLSRTSGSAFPGRWRSPASRACGGAARWLRDLLKALQPREGHGHTAGGPSRPCAGDRTPVMGAGGRIWAGPETGRPCGHLTGVT